MPRVILTHCSKQIVEGDEGKIVEQLEKWGAERGIQVQLAYEGFEVSIR